MEFIKCGTAGKILVCLIFILNFEGYSQDLQQDRYPNRVLKAEGRKMNGVKIGEWKYFYPDGKLMAKENFSEGILNGVAENYFPNGKLQSSENWQNGLLQDSSWYYRPDGSLERKGRFSNSQYDGTWTY